MAMASIWNSGRSSITVLAAFLAAFLGQQRDRWFRDGGASPADPGRRPCTPYGNRDRWPGRSSGPRGGARRSWRRLSANTRIASSSARFLRRQADLRFHGAARGAACSCPERPAGPGRSRRPSLFTKSSSRMARASPPAGVHAKCQETLLFARGAWPGFGGRSAEDRVPPIKVVPVLAPFAFLRRQSTGTGSSPCRRTGSASWPGLS